MALLIAILLPAIKRARATARTVICSSNLRQVGIGVQVYVSESDRILPLINERRCCSSPIPGGAGGGRGYNWLGLIEHVADGQGTRNLHCPADDRNPDPHDELRIFTPLTFDESTRAVERGAYSYGANFVGRRLPNRRIPWSSTDGPFGATGDDPDELGPVLIDTIPDPAETVQVLDAYYQDLSVKFSVIDAQISMNDALEGHGYWVTSLQLFRHDVNPEPDTPIGPNVLFADGHVRATVDFFRLTDDNFSFEVDD